MQNFSLFWGWHFGRDYCFIVNLLPMYFACNLAFLLCFTFLSKFFYLFFISAVIWQEVAKNSCISPSFIYRSKSKKNNGTEILSEVVCVVLTTCTRPFRLVDILAKYDLISFQRFFQICNTVEFKSYSYALI